MKSLALRFDSNHFVFAWDSQESKRKKQYPEYKAHRNQPKNREEEYLDEISYEQFDALRTSVLPGLGFKHNYVFRGYEADDIIASIVKNTHFETNTVVTTDSDLYQLLGHCNIFNPRTKKIFTNKDFAKKYRIYSKDWALVKGIAGCPSDNVKGIERVGEKTAIKFLLGKLGIHTKAYKNIKSKEGRKIIERNASLVKLPLKGIDELELEYMDFVRERFEVNVFREVFEEYGFYSFLRDMQSWIKAFGMV